MLYYGIPIRDMRVPVEGYAVHSAVIELSQHAASNHMQWFFTSESAASQILGHNTILTTLKFTH